MKLMTPANLTSTLGLLLVCAYYLVLWFRSGGHQHEPVVTRYQPPREFSPAMLRFIWKERFDDRTFWACVLSLVSRGIAKLEDEDGEVFVRPTGASIRGHALPQEETLLAESIFHGRSGRRVALNVTNENTAIAIWRISRYLHQAAVGKWFRPNYPCIMVGAAISLASVLVAANPQSIYECGALVLGLSVMVPGGYYLFFLLLRISDLFRTVREHIGLATIRRAVTLLLFVLPCVAAFALGGFVLGVNFGASVLVLTGCLVSINVACLLWMRLPTEDGKRLLNEIEGFRDFLRSVERLPKDRVDAPGEHVGLYEQYLPYAVALEVEQSWCDKFIALKSAFHEQQRWADARPFYLGMWDGKPVEVVVRYTRDFRS